MPHVLNSPPRIGQRLCGLSWLLACLVLGCTEPQPEEGLPVVVTSVPPLAYFAARIGGETIRVSSLVPPGTDPHHFEPAMTQLLDLNKAILYVDTGHPALEFESILTVRHLDDFPNLPTLHVADSMETDPRDPHLWTSPRVAAEIAATIAARLTQLLPAHAPAFQSNLDNLLADISVLDHRFAEWSQHSESNRSFIAHHAAWGYLCRDYGLQQFAIQQNHSEPSAATLGEVIRKGQAAKVQIILVQPGFAEESAQTVAKEMGARVFAIDPLGANWLDELTQLADAFAATNPLRSDPPGEATP